MKLKEIRFFNSVKVGAEELLTVSTSPGVNNKTLYRIELLEERLGLIRIEDLSKNAVGFSSIHNMQWCTELRDDDKNSKVGVGNIKANVVNGKGEDRGRSISKAK